MSMLKGFRIVSKHLKGESGRSMIEMLATLVIVGILSISALWGYRYAIEVHKENETVDWVVKSIVGARTGFIADKYGEQAEEDGSVRVPIKEVISGVTYLEPETDGVVYGFTTPTQAKVSVDVIDQKTFEVYVDEMTWNVCRKLLRANLEYTSAKLVKEETPHFVYTTSSSDEINDFCEIVDPAKRRPSQPVSNDPNVEQGVSFVLCFGDDCQGGCPPNKRFRAVVRRINGCVRRIYSVVPRARRMENAPIMKKGVLLTHLMSARMGVVMKDARIVCCVRITLMLRRVIAAARIKRRRVRVFVFQRIKNVVPPVLAFSVGKDYNVVRRQ